MSDQTSILVADLIQTGQSSKEVTANELFNASSPFMLYGRSVSRTSGLTWGYFGGVINNTFVANGTVTLAPSVTNYIEANPTTGAVTVNSVGWTGGGLLRCYAVTTNATAITNYIDWRTGSVGQTGPTGATGSAGTNGAGYGGTSATSLAIAIASKTFTTQAGLAYVVGSRTRAASNANGANYMEGLVTAYSGTTLTINVDAVGGAGTFADWNLSIAGSVGATGATGATGGGASSTSTLTDFANAAGTTTGLTYGYNAGTIRSDNATVAVVAGTVALAASVTNYVEITGAGVVSVNSSGFTSGRFPMCTVLTGSSTITTITDKRGFASVGGAGGSFTGGTLTSALNYAPPVTIASAATVNIGAAAANDVTVSGTTTITAFDAIAAGARRTTTFSGILVLTYNAASLILPGAANLTTAAGDVAEWISLGSGNWRCIDYTKASGAAVVSGGLADFTDTLNTAAPNATIPVAALSATNAAANVDAAFVPKGTGALTAQIADGTATGGNKRGTNTVDLQMNRSLTAQVASANYAVIGGGARNKVTGDYGVVCGGYANSVGSSSWAFIGGGSTNTSSGSASAVVGGDSNTASNTDTFVGAGNGNTASGSRCAVVGGISNVASGAQSFVGAGWTNTASGDYSWIAGGAQATTRGIYGMGAGASANIATQGDSQWGKYVLNGKTTSATAKVLTTSNAAASTINQVILPDNASYAFSARLTARNTTNGDTASYKFEGTIRRGSGAASTALVAAVTVTTVNNDSGAASWAVAVAADTTNGGLGVTVTGVAATNIVWVCVIDTVEATN